MVQAEELDSVFVLTDEQRLINQGSGKDRQRLFGNRLYVPKFQLATWQDEPTAKLKRSADRIYDTFDIDQSRKVFLPRPQGGTFNVRLDPLRINDFKSRKMISFHPFGRWEESDSMELEDGRPPRLARELGTLLVFGRRREIPVSIQATLAEVATVAALLNDAIKQQQATGEPPFNIPTSEHS